MTCERLGFAKEYIGGGDEVYWSLLVVAKDCSPGISLVALGSWRPSSDMSGIG